MNVYNSICICGGTQIDAVICGGIPHFDSGPKSQLSSADARIVDREIPQPRHIHVHIPESAGFRLAFCEEINEHPARERERPARFCRLNLRIRLREFVRNLLIEFILRSGRDARAHGHTRAFGNTCALGNNRAFGNTRA